MVQVIVLDFANSSFVFLRFPVLIGVFFCRFYGKPLIEFVQLPGDVLYLPQGMPHTVHNVDDNIAITENYLFTDALPDLVKAIAADGINPWVPDWNETLAFHNIYMKHSSKDDRLKMRDMYKLMTKLTRRYPEVC